MFRSCLSYCASHCFFFMLVSHGLVVCVCFRTFLHVVIAFICAMLKIEDQFWIEFTIDLFNCIHLFDAR